MSNIEKYEKAKDLVLSSEYDFNKLAQVHGAVNWEKEAAFATQLLKKNNYLCSVAYSNPDSLRDAVLNVAAIGLSLNPIRSLAYILPRDGRVCLDIGYRGFLQLGIDSGAFSWARCEIVHKEDTFEYRGMGVEPKHEFDPFGERGEIIGCYCTVKTREGDYLTDMMAICDVFAIRDRSKSYQAYLKKKVSCPWVSDETEMIKKTVIRRAYKMWPIPSETSQRLDNAMTATFEDHELDVTPMDDKKDELLQELNDKLVYLNKEANSEKFLKYLSTVFNRNVESSENLTSYELEKLHAILNQWVGVKQAKDEAEGEVELELALEETEEEEEFMSGPEPSFDDPIEIEEVQNENN